MEKVLHHQQTNEMLPMKKMASISLVASSSRNPNFSVLLMKSPRELAFFLVLVLLLAHDAIEATSIHVNEFDQEPKMAVSIMEKIDTTMAMAMNGGRRQLKSFGVCALCICCGGVRGMCLPSPCCYTINCNIPNRPFGFCSFTPKSCNCFGCHI